MATKSRSSRAKSPKKKPAVRARARKSVSRAPAVDQRVASLAWSDLEAGLRSGTTRAVGGVSQNDLRDYFGPEEFDQLQQLARFRDTVRSRAKPLGNVIFLHGITGSDLGVATGATAPDNIWVNFFRLINGSIERLKLAPDGASEADTGSRVSATCVNKRYYARAILELGARWNVTPFAYDWRRDIDEASNALAELIRRNFAGQPVHLVAHSLGGLVCRNFIRLEPKLWDSIKDPELVRGGRLIMLGTPNYGSFAIPQVMTGQDKMIDVLATLDVRHNLGEVLAITNTFVGTYMLLPAPAKLPGSLQALYRRPTWGEYAPSIQQKHLDRAFQFHQDLQAAPTIDPARMIYIAGCRQATLCNLRIVNQGDFDYELTYEGDGRVPHALGLLKDVPTYYVDEVHGDLARNESVISAVDELLEHGQTKALDTQVLRSMQRAVPTMRDYRTSADRQMIDDLGELARRAQQTSQAARSKGTGDEEEGKILRSTFSDDEARFAEDAIVKAALGSRSTPSQKKAAPPPPSRVIARPKPIRVTLTLADITEVKANMIVVGHYRGVPPTRAVGAIDQKLKHWIARAGQLGMIGGNLGETFFIPNVLGTLKANGVVLAGMGDFGRFARADLVVLMSNVTLGVSAFGLDGFASVLVGSGEGNLDRETALKALLEGVAAGADRFERDTKGLEAARKLTLVENNPAAFKRMEQQLRDMEKATRSGASTTAPIVLEKVERQKLPRKSAARGDAEDATPKLEEVRLTVEQIDGKFRFSALTETAIVPVREVSINTAFVTGAAKRLMESGTSEEQTKYGELLYTCLVPEDFHALIDSGKPLKLILDRTTASYPWEMACFRGTQDTNRLSNLGVDLRVTRQFRSTLSNAPGLAPPLNLSLKVLVIADPAQEPDYQLPGARLEGREVANVFRNFPARSHGMVIEVVERIGPHQCDPVEILALLLSGEFDIVHFAGHGNYNRADPKASGWIFGKEWVLTANEIFRARKVPRLVFANACFSAVTTAGETLTEDEQAQGLASIAEAFFARGVSNYVGSGWPVNDEQATKLAKLFYQELLAGRAICDALRDARASITDYGSTWGAYQHYGNATDVVVRKKL